MKKIFALLALVLGVVSCQTEPEGLDVNVGGEVETTVCVSLPEATRANSAVGAVGIFNNVDWNTYTVRYIMQIFDQNGRASEAEYVAYKDGNESNNSVTFPVRLVPNRDYNFVVWADIVTDVDKTDLHYNLHNGDEGALDLKNITLNNWVAMDETRDAYTGFHNTEKEGTKYTSSLPINITLTRPFAKLRVLTTDMQDLENLDLEPKKAVVKYDNKHYRSFNACNGQPFNKDIEEKEHTIEDVRTYGETGTLFVDYFFASSTEDETVRFDLLVYDQNGDAEVNKIKYNNFNTDIKVRSNYLTTIQGNILTDGNNVTVEVEDAFANAENPNDKPYYNEIVEVGNATDLQEAIDNSTEETTIVFGGNINLGDLLSAGILSTRAAAPLPIVIPEGKVVALDLNGFNLTTPFVEGSDTNHTYAFENRGSLTIQDSKGNGQIIARGIFNYGTMTLKSGIINACDGNGGYGVRNYPDAEFIMNGGAVITSYEDGDDRVSGNYDATPIRVDEGATATITNGTITNICNYTSAIENHGTTTIDGGSFTSVHSTVTNYGTMTINGPETTIKCDGEYTSAHPIYANGETSNTYVNGGNFIGNNKAGCYYVAAEKNTNVYISGGIFTNAGQAAFTGEGNIVVTGGQFDKDPSLRVVKGYVAEKNGDVFVVSKIALAENFADNSWDKIILACQNNIVPETWEVGNNKTMTIGDKEYAIRIIGKNHDTYTAGGKAPLTFQIAEVCGSAAMNATQTNTTGWSGSQMRTVTMPEILAAMPVKDAIKAVNKETLNGTRDGLETTSDKLFLLSEIEVNGSVFYSNGFAEGSRYAFYTSLDSQIMNASYWLRGPGKSNAIGFTQIISSGYMANGSAECACGVVFGFCF